MGKTPKSVRTHHRVTGAFEPEISDIDSPPHSRRGSAITIKRTSSRPSLNLEDAEKVKGLNLKFRKVEDDKMIEIELKKNKKFVMNFLHQYLAPFLITLVSFYLRHYEIGSNNSVIWDEAHFAKFGSFYNKHTFYHDVHPPLGKMLCGLSEWLVGYNASSNPDYKFDSGSTYPGDINYYGMRLFQVFFSAALAPIAWFTCRSLNMNILTSYLISIMICLDSSFIVLGKFVLLDSFLFFFTGTTILCLAQVHRHRLNEGKKFTSDFWFILLGLSIGCVCSIKWVGLFVTAVVGIYTIVDLWAKFWDTRLSMYAYIKCWIRRIISLIMIPACIYMLCFKIHLDLLYLPGEGSGSMNTLFQANMAQTDIVAQPRFIQLDDLLTLRSQGMSSNLLHSHAQTYPAGSRQHQITTYGYKDANNNWKVQSPRVGGPLSGYLKDGDVIRLEHMYTRASLHTHEVKGHVSKQFFEVSGYGDGTFGDEKDDWIVEIVSQMHSANSSYVQQYETNSALFTDYVHPVSTTFRLKHNVLGCYLGTTGKSYPTWGFQQGEVVCMDSPAMGSLAAMFDTSTNWNIESVLESTLPVDTEYKFPKSNFLHDFIQLQRSMAASNNALTPDPSKNDNIASSWWEWPIMSGGIRMSNFSPNVRKYYMFDNPIALWLTTLSIPVFLLNLVSITLKWRNQSLIIDEYALWKLFMVAIVPLLGFVLHYLPFIVMGRVTYFHHYMPALYFVIFMFGFSVDYMTIAMRPVFRTAIYWLLYTVIVLSFLLFSPTCLGMTGPISNYSYLVWFPTWEIGNYQPFLKSVPFFWTGIKKQVAELIYGAHKLRG